MLAATAAGGPSRRRTRQPARPGHRRTAALTSGGSPAAIAWHAIKAGEPLTVLSLRPELYAGTGITPLNPA
ncbi:hypothetical protein ACWEWD_19395 [Streptomyces tendae]